MNLITIKGIRLATTASTGYVAEAFREVKDEGCFDEPEYLADKLIARGFQAYVIYDWNVMDVIEEL